MTWCQIDRFPLFGKSFCLFKMLLIPMSNDYIISNIMWCQQCTIFNTLDCIQTELLTTQQSLANGQCLITNNLYFLFFCFCSVYLIYFIVLLPIDFHYFPPCLGFCVHLDKLISSFSAILILFRFDLICPNQGFAFVECTSLMETLFY